MSDCVERLKLLDGMGRVWGQNMVLCLRGANLVLTDTETKVHCRHVRFYGTMTSLYVKLPSPSKEQLHNMGTPTIKKLQITLSYIICHWHK